VARVSGHLINPDGTLTSRGGVTLAPETAAGGLGISYTATVRPDGSFEIANVPPGSYILHARGDDGPTRDFARQRLFVEGAAVTDLQIVLGRGAVVTGTVVFTGSSRAPMLSQVRVAAVPAEPSLVGGPVTTADNDGDFVILGMQPGYWLFRAAGEIPGWILQSVVADGRDITDIPIEMGTGKSLDDVIVRFTDSAAEIVGTLTSNRGVPVTDYTMLAFPTDPSLWRPQSRHIVTARPDQYGTFRVRGLPAGTYFLSAIDPVEPGQWFDPSYLEQHRAAAARVDVGAGESKTQDFRVPTR
jgi:hypothetical protein